MRGWQIVQGGLVGPPGGHGEAQRVKEAALCNHSSKVSISHALKLFVLQVAFSKKYCSQEELYQFLATLNDFAVPQKR